MFVMIVKVFPTEENKICSVEFFYTSRRKIRPEENVRDPHDSQNLIGRWMGETPVINKWYDVEIGVTDELVWGRNVIPQEHNESFIKKQITGMTILQGLLEVSEDGFATLMIGNSLHVLDIIGILKPFVGDVNIQVAEIKLYDTGILRY